MVSMGLNKAYLREFETQGGAPTPCTKTLEENDVPQASAHQVLIA